MLAATLSSVASRQAIDGAGLLPEDQVMFRRNSSRRRLEPGEPWEPDRVLRLCEPGPARVVLGAAEERNRPCPSCPGAAVETVHGPALFLALPVKYLDAAHAHTPSIILTQLIDLGSG